MTKEKLTAAERSIIEDPARLKDAPAPGRKNVPENEGVPGKGSRGRRASNPMQVFRGTVKLVFSFYPLQFSLMRITNYTLSGGKDPGSYFKDRIRSIVTVILTILVMMAMVIILAYGQLVMNFLSKKFLISDELDWAWVVFRWPVAGALFLLLISFIYYVLPANKNRRRFKEILPGSIFCAIGMLLVTMVYSSYTAHAVTQNVLYGSMASIAALMFWFYLISWVMCLGILVNKVWLDTSADKVEKERR